MLLAGATNEALEALCGHCMQLLAPHMEGYIWQHEPLRLQSSSRQLPPWLAKKRGAAVFSSNEKLHSMALELTERNSATADAPAAPLLRSRLQQIG